MSAITVTAPAKINIILRVLGKRADGYHDLSMVMVPLKLADELRLETISSGIELICDGIVDDGMRAEKNLAYRAARAVQETTGAKQGVRIHLTKKIPVAAGLGGGSSDAATVLKGLNQLWDLGMMSADLARIGVTLGADVPFFCYDGACLVEGIGDRVTPLASFPTLHLLLVNPGFPLSTKEVYEAWDREQLSGCHCEERSDAAISSDVRRSPRHANGVTRDDKLSLHNDLEPIALQLRPEIGDVKQWLQSHGAAGVLMSGSGPTVFGIFADAAARDRASTQVINPEWKIFATETTL